MSNKLPAPIVDNLLPAIGSNLDKYVTIKFPMDIDLNNIVKYKYRIKSVITGKTIVAGKVNKYSNYLDRVYITSALQDYCTTGNTYQFQCCFVSFADNTEIEGYWSNIGIFKYIDSTKIKFDNDSIIKDNGYLKINYSSDILSERLIEYQIFYYTNNDILINETPVYINNINNDEIISNKIFTEIHHYPPADMDLGQINKIEVTIKTTSGLSLKGTSTGEWKPTIYSFPQVATNDNSFDVDSNLGYIKVSLRFSKVEDKIPTSGKYNLKRTSSATNYSNYQSIAQFQLSSSNGLNIFEYIDRNIENNQTYSYYIENIQNYNLYQIEVKDKATTVTAQFEDIFLMDKDYCLKIAFNPDVSNFKNTVLEQKIETIGNRTPFIYRNGKVSYKEFQISGLLSFLQDEEQFFGKNYILNIDEKRPAESQVNTTREQTNDALFSMTNLNLTNIAKEKDFKLKVLEWLHNGKPKVFKSPYEGNYIVQLTNVSLTPEKTLGRMLHSFSATAYEVADYSKLASLKDL